MSFTTQLLKSNLFFGTGHDSDFTVSGSTSSVPYTLTCDMYYRNLTVPAGQYLNPNGFRILVSQLCTVNGTITVDGAAGSAPTAGAARTRGTLSAMWAGGAGTTIVNTNGSNGAAAINSMGGVGGNGGAGFGGTGTGGAGGVSTNNSPLISATEPWNAHFGYFTGKNAGVDTRYSTKAFSGGTGGGGGGSGNTVTGATGGGGAGGGVIMLAARYLIGSGTLSARGGNGGQRLPNDGVVGSGGQGGGGGGGYIVVFTSSSFPGTLTIDVSGGLGAITNATPSSEDGSNGAVGTYTVYDVPVSTLTTVTSQSRYLPNNSVFWFGSAIDGDLSVADNQTVTLTETKFYRNVTLGNGAQIFTSAFRMFVNGTVMLNTGSKIHCNGKNGGNGTSSGGGAAGLASFFSTIGNGGAGGYNGVAATNPVTGASTLNTGRSSGSGGGTGASAGRTGFTAADAREYFGTHIMSRWFVPAFLCLPMATGPQPISFAFWWILGMGGGGGGGPVVSPLVGGGGGGGGGGAVILVANRIVGTGSIECKGGNGGSVDPPNGSTGDVGGGGGGSGGMILLVMNEALPNTVTLDVSGGTGGTNAQNPSANGFNGATGFTYEWNLNSS